MFLRNGIFCTNRDVVPPQPNLETARALFLKNFAYLTPDNKRNGFNLFCNDELTNQICQQAIQLKAKLNALDLQLGTEQDFLSIISSAISSVRALRKSGEYSTHHSYFTAQHDPTMRDGLAYSYSENYFYTHGNGLFEKTIIKALNAAKPYLSSDSVDGLIRGINSYHSEKIVTDSETYAA